MNKAMISVVIPAYNSERSIERCVKSVLSQSYPSFEVIVVDDGSKDKTLTICLEMEKTNPRLRVYHQTNQGVSAARNAGLDQACGEWVAFVDADDQADPEYLDRMFTCVSHSDDIDLYVGSLNVFRGKKKSKVLQLDSRTVSAKDLDTIFGDIKLHKHGFPFGKLYRLSLLRENNIRFDTSVNMAEDCLLMMNYILACASKKQSLIFCDEEAHYDYFVQKGSLSNTVGSFEKEYQNYKAIREAIHSLNKLLGTKAVKKELLSNVGWFGERCINSIYQKREEDKTKRLSQLSHIDTSELTFRGDERFGQWVLKFFLIAGLHRIYDYLRWKQGK